MCWKVGISSHEAKIIRATITYPNFNEFYQKVKEFHLKLLTIEEKQGYTTALKNSFGK